VDPWMLVILEIVAIALILILAVVSVTRQAIEFRRNSRWRTTISAKINEAVESANDTKLSVATNIGDFSELVKALTKAYSEKQNPTT
jgi:cell division protein FtsL